MLTMTEEARIKEVKARQKSELLNNVKPVQNMEEMREKIAKIIDNAIIADQVDGRFGSEPYADQIISLFNAKSEEEVRAEERKIIGNWLESTAIQTDIEVFYDIDEWGWFVANLMCGDAIDSIQDDKFGSKLIQGKEVKRCTVKKCTVKKCGLYPEFCPDASNNGSYTTCILMKKEKKKR